MAGSIKGIIVEIGGDTSGLQKAIKEVTKVSNSLTKELRDVDKLLKFNPKSTELLAQKQEILAENIQTTTMYLNGLKHMQEEYDNQGLDKNSENYRNLQREIIRTEQNLRNLKIEASRWTQVSKSLDEMSSKFKKIGSTLQSVGRKFTTLSIGIGALFGAGVKYTADIETYTKAFETFLGSAEKAVDAINKIKQEALNSPFDTKELVKANQMLIVTGESADDTRKTIGALADAIALTGGGNDELSRMASNLQQIKNIGKASAQDIKQFGYAGIDIYGLLAKTTGKSVKELKKMDITYDDITKALQVAASEGGKYYKGQERMTQTLNGQVSKLKKTTQELIGEFAESLVPTIKNVTDSLQGVVDWFKNLDDSQKQMITKIAVMVAAIGPILLIVGKLFTAGGVILKIGSSIAGLIAKLSVTFGGLSGVLAALTGPIGITIAAIAGLVAAFVYLWNTSEDFRKTMSELGQQFVDIWENTIKPTFAMLIEAVSELWTGVLAPLLSWIMTVFGPRFQTIFNTIGGTVALVIKNFTTKIKTITGVLKGIIKFISGAFSGDWKKAWEGVKDIFGSVFNGIKELVRAPLNWIIDRINDFIREVNKIKIPEGVPKIGGMGFNIQPLEHLATGGIVKSPTLSWVGEGKSPEAVIPLDRNLSNYFADALEKVNRKDNVVVNFYPQKMTDAEMDHAFNYINRKFGLLY